MSFNPDRINIHELTIEEPEKQTELLFDVERDISKEDWEGINMKIEGCILNNSWSDYASQAMKVKILDPSKNIGRDDNARQGMERKLDAYKSSNKIDNEWGSFLSQAMAMKILDPETDVGLNNDIEQRLGGFLDTLRNRPRSFCFHAMEMKIISPNMVLNIGETIWKEMEKDLESQRVSNNWIAFARDAVAMKILNPAVDLKLDNRAWEGMRAKLEYYRVEPNEHWPNFFEQAMNMKILAAEEVKITDKGLEINMRKKKDSFNTDVPPIPEIKKF